jgi:site-specific DNA-cytosine methylase
MRDQLNLFSLARHRPERSDLIVDCFAGGGGASLGITQALGRPVDIAINHSRQAIALHAKNHPDTDHYCEDIWTVEPKAATKGKPVLLLWASPDCRHFSRAKGGKPASPRVRSLAWVVVTWARRVRPRVICLENVEEFQTWGPLHDDGTPDKERQGQTFRRWASHLRNLGYALEYRSLRACDYGAPTTRRRLFIVARCDGNPLVWPTPTHGPGRPHPHRTAAECIDWTIPVPSIFGRKKPLADATEARIAAGIKRFVLDREPFIVPIRSTWAPDAEVVLAVEWFGEFVGGRRCGALVDLGGDDDLVDSRQHPVPSAGDDFADGIPAFAAGSPGELLEAAGHQAQIRIAVEEAGHRRKLAHRPERGNDGEGVRQRSHGVLGGFFRQLLRHGDQIGLPVLRGFQTMGVGPGHRLPRRMLGQIVVGVGAHERRQDSDRCEGENVLILAEETLPFVTGIAPAWRP